VIIGKSRAKRGNRPARKRDANIWRPLWVLSFSFLSGSLSPLAGSLFVASAADVVPIALSGMQAPGLQTGIPFTEFQFSAQWPIAPTIGANGEVAFYAEASPQPYPQPGTSGIWRGSPSGLDLVALRTDHAGGFPHGVNYYSVTGDNIANDSYLYAPPLPVVDALGEVTFEAAVSGLGTTTANDSVLSTGLPGQLGIVSREGD
jgi:hypothetical protein